MKLLPEERETIILFDVTQEPADIWTCSKKVSARLLKAGLEPAEKPISEGHGWRFYVDKRCVRIKVGNKSCYIGSK